MAKNSPVDDDLDDLGEFFGEEVGIHAVPDDDEREIKGLSLHDIPAAINKDILERINHPRLATVTISYEYYDGIEYSNWVNMNYVIKET
jgi:hypothetical protein